MKQFSKIDRSADESQQEPCFEYRADEDPVPDFVCLRDRYALQVRCVPERGARFSVEGSPRRVHRGRVYGPSEAELARAQRLLFSQLGWSPAP